MCFREKQNKLETNQDTYASPAAEKSSLDEQTDYTTLEQGLTMQYLTVSHNQAGDNQDYTDAASKQEAQSTARQYENVDEKTQSARDSQDGYAMYGVINDGYEAPQRPLT